MANNRNVYQQLYTISIPRTEFYQKIVLNQNLSRKDLRVALALLTVLDGYTLPDRISGTTKDPMNFKSINIDEIAASLEMSKKDVKKSLCILEDESIITQGTTTTVKNGYRFMI